MAAGLSWWEACLLGLVQGLTEFLPVSSDGHLAVVQRFLTPMPPAEKLAVDVALHLGTLVAVLVYFREELIQLVAGLFGRGPAWTRVWPTLLVVGTVPAAIAGFTLKSRIETSYDSLPVIGASFLFTGSLLFGASLIRHADRRAEDLTVVDALVVGLFQTLALLPGVSRSGTTISAALFRRTRADIAARFSFLLSIPAIAGALVVEGPSIVSLDPSLGGPLAVGVVVAGITGFLAIAALLRVVRGGKLQYFAYYCWALGAVVLAVAFGGGRA